MTAMAEVSSFVPISTTPSTASDRFGGGNAEWLYLTTTRRYSRRESPS
ncbi:hypothetical protein CSPAE12_09757 [Colletotrichum incanum]|nr:hypothetical protein CSPAE12_09757 [Colletotrichum incanum]